MVRLQAAEHKVLDELETTMHKHTLMARAMWTQDIDWRGPHPTNAQRPHPHPGVDNYIFWARLSKCTEGHRYCTFFFVEFDVICRCSLTAVLQYVRCPAPSPNSFPPIGTINEAFVCSIDRLLTAVLKLLMLTGYSPPHAYCCIFPAGAIVHSRAAKCTTRVEPPTPL